MAQACRQCLLISNSTLHGSGYLDHCGKQIQDFLNSKQVKKVLFVPYALKDHDEYASIARKKFNELGFQLDSIHEYSNSVTAANSAEAFFIGGGNTFRLLKTLYDEKLIAVIKRRVLLEGVPYIGSSAGSNVATVSINTTNDMPIVCPPSFEALDLVPFNINPHYIDTDPNSRHMGETREQRILQYHEEAHARTVLVFLPPMHCIISLNLTIRLLTMFSERNGMWQLVFLISNNRYLTIKQALREGCMLLVEGRKATLMGCTNARLFLKGKPATEYKPGDDMSFLL